MLEIDVDIGRLAAFGRDKTLEEQLGSDRVDRGDPKHIADGAVGGRTAALAEDLAPPRLGHDRMHGQEIGGIVEVCDEFQLMLELLPDLPVDPFRITKWCLLPGEALEFLLRRPPGHLDLIGILVFELFETEGAARRQLHAARDGRTVLQIAPEQALHLRSSLEVSVREPLAPGAQLIDRAFLADAGNDVLQQPAIGRMIEDIACRDGGDAGGGRQRRQVAQTDGIARAAADRQGHIGSVAEDAARSGERFLRHGIGAVGRQHRDQPFIPFLDVRPIEMAGPFAGAGLADTEQATHPAIGRAVGRIDE